MGIVKQMMIELEESRMEETVVEFECPKCQKQSDGTVEIPVMYEDYLADTNVSIDVECIWCNENFDAEMSSDVDGCKITLREHPDVELEFEPIFFDFYDEDDWLEEDYFYESIVSPISEFNLAHNDIVTLINEHGTEDGYYPLNRMIFAQSFSILETYLCDRYLNLIFQSNDNIKIFVLQHSEMREMKISAQELLQNADLSISEIIKQKITKLIKSTLFHNLPKTKALYRLFQTDLFQNDLDKKFLLGAVPLRHHCVHRNGRDLDGNELGVFTKAYTLDVIAAMKRTVEFIEKNIAAEEENQVDE